jgi:hypothetical protein
MEQTRTGTAFATLAVAALALCLFAAAAAASKSEPGTVLLARRAAMLELMHHQAEIALVTAAQDRSFEAYFRAGDEAERAALRQQLERLADNIRTTFLVDGVCLVGVSGEEIASTDVEAAPDELEDAEAEFFREAFLHPARHVYLSPIFVADTTRRWVVSYATPIVIDGRVRAILHYERSLAGYQNVAAEDLGDVAGYMLLVDPDGWIIADSRRPVGTDQQGDSVDPAAYFSKFEWDGAGLADLQVRLGRDGGFMELTMPGPDGDYRIQYRTVRGWTLLLFEKV